MEDFPLRELAEAYPDARRTPHEVHRTLGPGRGEVLLYPFGSVVFRNVDADARKAEIATLREVGPGLQFLGTRTIGQPVWPSSWRSSAV